MQVTKTATSFTHQLNRSQTVLTIGLACFFLLTISAYAASDRTANTAPAETTPTNSATQQDTIDLIVFRSDNKIGVIHPDGSGQKYLGFPHLLQRQWYGGRTVPNSGKIILSSQEYPQDPNAGFYDKAGLRFARTHLWMYDYFSESLEEIKLPSLLSPFAVTGDRILLSGEPDNDNMTKIMSCRFDGTDLRLLHDCGGYAYGTSLSPDQTHVAYHLTKNGYEIYVLDLKTNQRQLLAGDPSYLYFGTEWSPDGLWVLYQGCLHKSDPMHSRSDLYISRPDGSEQRMLTAGLLHWFGTSYGTQDNPGYGSDFPRWSPQGRWITYVRCLPGSQTAWVYQTDKTDTDHFNCAWQPDKAKGGTQICLVDINGNIRSLTCDEPSLWNWRTVWSTSGDRIVFARAAVGKPAELWIMNADGTGQQFLTRGFNDKGADFPNWITLTKN